MVQVGDLNKSEAGDAELTEAQKAEEDTLVK